MKLYRALGMILTTTSLGSALACTSDLEPEGPDALEAADEDAAADDEDADAPEAGEEDDEIDEDAPVDQHGFTVIETPEGPKVVAYDVDYGGRALVDGDIDIGPADQLITPEQYELLQSGPANGVSFAHTPIPIWGTAWANDEVLFVAPTTPFPAVNTNIMTAINQLDTLTDLTFTQVDGTVATALGWDHIRFAYDPFKPANAGSSDSVGVKGGAQYISLGSAASTSLVIHELGHAIGLYHEHQRPDREAFVTYMPVCVQGGKGHNFDVHLGTSYGAYDKASIMHYGAYTWSIAPGSCPTLLPVSGGTGSIGSNTLSPLDIAGINAIY